MDHSQLVSWRRTVEWPLPLKWQPTLTQEEGGSVRCESA